MKSKLKDAITKISMKLDNMPAISEDEDVFAIESLVTLVYFGISHDKSRRLNKLRKVKFKQSITNDLKNLAPSFSELYMQY